MCDSNLGRAEQYVVSHYLVPLQSQVGISRLWGGGLSRDVAQLVARHVRDVEVGSSSLLIPTQGDRRSRSAITFFLCSPITALRGGGFVGSEGWEGELLP